MKYNAPEGCSGISVGGEQFNVDENGQIEVPDSGEYAPLLAPHGFTPAPATQGGNEGGAKPSEGLTAEKIKEALTAKGIEFKSNASKAELAALLDAAPATQGGNE